uniref:6-Cys domain-containing protein n=1 Tax=Babesia bovis TaxID=5865 RepID=A0A0S3J4M0_BABBO|nr:hypothetical protein [Babesia bovis]ALR73027.1 hypothetical protein [Babesia bovis]
MDIQNTLNRLALACFIVFCKNLLIATATPSIHLDLSHNNKQYDDFSVNEVIVAGPKEVVITCGNGRDEDVEHTMYPSDPVSKMLLPPEGNDFTSAVEKEVASYSLYRSSDLNFEVKKANDVPVSVKISRTVDTLIMAKDPENFSLNFACKYQSKDGSNAPVYKWVTIKFEAVYPMAYGCETGNNMLFKNSRPIVSNILNLQIASCSFEIEPGMIFGIYCKAGERLDPGECFSDADLSDYKGAITPYIPKFAANTNPASTLSTRFRLFKVHDGKLPNSVDLSCSCIGASGKTTRILYVNILENDVVIASNQTNNMKADLMPTIKEVIMNMYPGNNITVKYVPDGEVFLSRGRKVTGQLRPTNPDTTAFNGLPVESNPPTLIKDFIGSRGVDITYTKVKDKMVYKVKCADDALLVLKSNTPFMFYNWKVNGVPGEVAVNGILKVGFNIMPTDPYTYGCGVDSADLFRDTGFQLRQEGRGRKVTHCKVNPYLSSPVGFYCPEGFVLEPPNCFSEMLHKDKEVVVPLSDFEPLARALEGRHIKVADFHTSTSNRDHIRYSSVELMCRCLDKEGRVRASITLNLQRPSNLRRQWNDMLKPTRF